MRNKSKIGVTSAKVSKKLRLKQLRPLGGRPQQQQKQLLEGRDFPLFAVWETKKREYIAWEEQGNALTRCQFKKNIETCPYDSFLRLDFQFYAWIDNKSHSFWTNLNFPRFVRSKRAATPKRSLFWNSNWQNPRKFKLQSWRECHDLSHYLCFRKTYSSLTLGFSK